MQLTIDSEFSSLIPPLTDEEFSGLEKSIKEEGCRDALVVWNNDGKQILIDGHNRYKICQKYGIQFRTVEKEFSHRLDVILWMVQNQMSRRNLPPYVRTTLALKAEEAIKAKTRERQLKGVSQEPVIKKDLGQKSDKGKEKTDKQIRQAEHNDNRATTQIAKIAGVSRDTVQKVKVINEKGSEQLKQQVRSGDKSINGAFNEIVKKESKRLPTASEYREQAQARHDELKEQKIVSVDEIARDKRDVALLSNEIRADIAKAVKPIDKLYVMLTSKELDVSLLTDVDKRMSIASIKQATSLLNQIANMIEKG